MKKGFEEVKYGDETFLIDKQTGKIQPTYKMRNSQGRTVKQEIDSARMVGYAVAGLIIGIVIAFLFTYFG